MPFTRRSKDAQTSATSTASDEQMEFRAELGSRLHSLDENCLDSLVKGIHAATAGDLTVEVVAVTKPLSIVTDDAGLTELEEVFNSMLSKAQEALNGYNDLREQLRVALGDQSCLIDLTSKLHSLSDVCLAGLGAGLQAAAKGDLTVEAIPVTTSLETRSGRQLGELGETFNTMLSQAQGGLGSYNEMRTSSRR